MNHTLWVLSTTPGSAGHLQRGWSAVCSLFYIVQSIYVCNVVTLLKHSKGFREGHSWNIISSEEFVCMVRESSDCNWSEQKKSVLKSSVGIREGGREEKEECWSKHSEVREDALLREETARDQHWRFCELCTLAEPGGSAHAADKKCTYAHIVGIHHNTSCMTLNTSAAHL